jgi:GNAT superfamily N-acetyltransferase
MATVCRVVTSLNEGPLIAAGLPYEVVELTPGCPGHAGLQSLLYETWTRDFRLSPRGRSMPKDAFYAWQRARITHLLERGARVYVCRDPEQPSVGYAWLCADRAGSELRCHYAYTKAFARGQGMFTALLEHAVAELGEGAELVTYTHDPAKQTGGDTDKTGREKLRALGLEYRPLAELAGRAA